MSGLAGKKILIVDDIQNLTMFRGFLEGEMNSKVREDRDSKEA